MAPRYHRPALWSFMLTATLSGFRRLWEMPRACQRSEVRGQRSAERQRAKGEGAKGGSFTICHLIFSIIFHLSLKRETRGTEEQKSEVSGQKAHSLCSLQEKS
jgi:hypothetical protein